MTAAEQLTKRLQEAGLTTQQVIEAITAVQEYREAIDARQDDEVVSYGPEPTEALVKSGLV